MGQEHISDIDAAVVRFTSSEDFYTLYIEHDKRQRTNHLRFEIHEERFPKNDLALMIGDVVHNLRSALDLAWYEVVFNGEGTPTKWTRFPIRDTSEELMGPLTAALKEKMISLAVAKLILETIKPHSAGNIFLWGLDDLNIRDKHQLLIPVLKLMRFLGIRLENEKGKLIYPDQLWFMDASCSIRLREADDMLVTIKDKGRATATILFDLGIPFEGEAIIPTLHRISEAVAGTIEAFEILLAETP